MLDVHLFFVKWFGCRIVEDQMPIDVGPFALSLRERTAHPNVYLSFIKRHLSPNAVRFAGPGPVIGDDEAGRCTHASTYYSLGELDIQVTWFEFTPIRNVPFAWHPRETGKVIQFDER